jgi:hypothetical protein
VNEAQDAGAMAWQLQMGGLRALTSPARRVENKD